MIVSRSIRRLFTIGAALSAVLLVLVVAAWVRSYFATDSIRLQPRVDYVLRSYVVGWGRGYLVLGTEEPRLSPDTSLLRLESERPIALNGAWFAKFEIFHLAGARFIALDRKAMVSVPVRDYLLYAPFWLVAMLFGALPAAWVVGARQRRATQRRIDAGQCVRCGYDLRATPDKCPECGSAALA